VSLLVGAVGAFIDYIEVRSNDRSYELFAREPTRTISELRRKSVVSSVRAASY
jgi:hypothetical protein